MHEPLRLKTLAQFHAVVSSGSGLLITDAARAPTFHADPDGCEYVGETHFRTKVIVNRERNGGYFAVPSLADARARWPGARACQSAACSQGAAGPHRLELLGAVLGDVTGSEVRVRRDPPTGVEALMPGWASTQRIALGQSGDDLVLCTWPAELKSQAKAVYGTELGAAIIELAAGSDDWLAKPTPHLAFNGARRNDRFYFRCPLPLDEYVARWSQPDNLSEVHGHPIDAVRTRLWPWLCRQGYADPADPENGPGLDRYMKALERRRSLAHLRPGILLSKRCQNDVSNLRRDVTDGVADLARTLQTPPNK